MDVKESYFLHNYFPVEDLVANPGDLNNFAPLTTLSNICINQLYFLLYYT